MSTDGDGNDGKQLGYCPMCGRLLGDSERWRLKKPLRLWKTSDRSITWVTATTSSAASRVLQVMLQ